MDICLRYFWKYGKIFYGMKQIILFILMNYYKTALRSAIRQTMCGVVFNRRQKYQCSLTANAEKNGFHSQQQ